MKHTGDDNISEVGSTNEATVPSAGLISPSPVRRQGVYQRPLIYILCHFVAHYCHFEFCSVIYIFNLTNFILCIY